MTIFIILIALLIVAAGFIGRSAIMARIDHKVTPAWVFEFDALVDGGMSTDHAMALVMPVRHPKDARCRRTGGGCYISRNR